MAAYPSWVNSLLSNYISGTPFMAMLVTTAYVQLIAHDFRSDVTSAEITGSGYTAGGVLVTGVAIESDGADIRFHCDPINFGAIDTTDLAGIVFYEDVGSSATDPLVVADLFGLVEVEDVLNYTYTPAETGLIVASIGGI